MRHPVCYITDSLTEESLLLLSSLGLQTSTSSPYVFLSPTTRFIPTSQIRDILIHEAFRGFEVRYYLVCIVEGEKEAVVVFGKVLPGREVLEEVWRGARSVLWGRGEDKKMRK
jgi:phosphatidylinositol glycan class H protein